MTAPKLSCDCRLDLMFPSDFWDSPCFEKPLDYAYKERRTALVAISDCILHHGDCVKPSLINFVAQHRPLEEYKMKHWIDIAGDPKKITSHLQCNFPDAESKLKINIEQEINSIFKKIYEKNNIKSSKCIYVAFSFKIGALDHRDLKPAIVLISSKFSEAPVFSPGKLASSTAGFDEVKPIPLKPNTEMELEFACSF